MQITKSMNIFADRIMALRALMEEKGWDAVVLTGSDPHGSEYPALRWKQVEWLTGFSGEAGDLVVTQDHAGLWTDSRYFIQASKVLPPAGVSLHKTRQSDSVSIPDWLSGEAFEEGRLSIVVAVDSLSFTAGQEEDLRKAFLLSGRCEDGGEQSFKIVGVPDLLDALWEDRPVVPQSPIITLGEELVGESRRSKLLWLRNFALEKNCDALLLSSLDEIAWTLNVRGSDIAYNPFVLSYLLVTLDEAFWFVRKGGRPDGETLDSFGELAGDGVRIENYDEVGLAVASRLEDGGIKRLFADPATLNVGLSRLLQDSGEDRLVFGTSPVQLRKAVKNGTEVALMREAHLEDGLAMEKFLYWLERKLEYGEPVSEWDAACRLGDFRGEIPEYRGDSFETISAYGAGAALPHYVTPMDDAPLLERRGLYLCDSGGQYLFGTTDITRTVPLGPLTALEKEDYTLVLRGHIDLARAVFPKGTAGCQLDVLAREPLWRCKRNFGHGTGHGVGFFLGVHEGPQDIRQNFNSVPLLPGMIVSDEPGIYREGRHGVRHESLLLVVPEGSNDFGSWLRFEVLTLCHIDTSAIVPELLGPEQTEWLNEYNARVYRTLAPRLPQAVALWLKEKTAPV